MDRSQLAELHYITAIDNVSSMLKLGLLCHVSAESVMHTSVAMDAIQARRARKSVPGGRRLHEYVNLYINGRNIMLSKVLHETSIDAVCLLQVSPGCSRSARRRRRRSERGQRLRPVR